MLGCVSSETSELALLRPSQLFSAWSSTASASWYSWLANYRQVLMDRWLGQQHHQFVTTVQCIPPGSKITCIICYCNIMYCNIMYRNIICYRTADQNTSWDLCSSWVTISFNHHALFILFFDADDILCIFHRRLTWHLAARYRPARNCLSSLCCLMRCAALWCWPVTYKVCAYQYRSCMSPAETSR